MHLAVLLERAAHQENRSRAIGLNGRSVDMVFWLKRILGRHCAQRTGGSCTPPPHDTPVAVGAPLATSPFRAHTSLNEFPPGRQSERRRDNENIAMPLNQSSGQRARNRRRQNLHAGSRSATFFGPAAALPGCGRFIEPFTFIPSVTANLLIGRRIVVRNI